MTKTAVRQKRQSIDEAMINAIAIATALLDCSIQCWDVELVLQLAWLLL